MELRWKDLKYVLVTPARNEEDFIEKTIQSVLAQTVLPKRWVIVNDGSADRTGEIVQRYTRRHDWIELVNMPEHLDRQFAAKVHSFNAGYSRLVGCKYDVIGNLDADISFDPDYFEYLLDKFQNNRQLGVIGTPFVEGEKLVYDHDYMDQSHVSGACQLFRRECFEQIGGYTPIKGGGIDWAAVTTARMMGWQTRTFTDKVFRHHRSMGTGNGGLLMSRYRHGVKDYYLGGHPLWQLFRCCFQMTRPPYLMGGVFLFLGYMNGVVTRMERPLSNDLIQFHRAEQMRRLRSIVGKVWNRNRKSAYSKTQSATT
ncbi:MAG: glycosyltransferase family 2 protein [Chitinispirillaceae bacterium]